MVTCQKKFHIYLTERGVNPQFFYFPYLPGGDNYFNQIHLSLHIEGLNIRDMCCFRSTLQIIVIILTVIVTIIVIINITIVRSCAASMEGPDTTASTGTRHSITMFHRYHHHLHHHHQVHHHCWCCDKNSDGSC